ncbi:MAG TPA: transcriptional regulator [Firmicutes bacterium]|nr:transcriptional regulator [Bacillota bacterium]
MKRLKESAQRFQILADPIRLQICLLLQDGEMCVGQLSEALGVHQPKVSYHLKRLYEGDLVCKRNENTWSYYSLCTDLRTWVNGEVDTLFAGQSRGAAIERPKGDNQRPIPVEGGEIGLADGTGHL